MIKIYFDKRVRSVFVLLMVICAQIGHAAVISVDGDCTLHDAIIAANTNTSTGQCIAGNDEGGSDTIILTSDIVLQTPFENDAQFGRTGTPAIDSFVILEGDGHLIERDPSLTCELNSTLEANEFRLLRVAPQGNFDLRNIILRNGCADGTTPDSTIGGAVLNFNGTLTLSNSIIERNKAEFRGGGIDTTFGTSAITNTVFNENEVNFAGAALSNFTSSSSIERSTLSNNIAGNRGGAIWNLDGTGGFQNSTLTLINNTLSANSANQNGGAIYNENAQIINSHFNTLSDNTSTDVGSAIYNTATGLVEVSHFLFNNNTNAGIECFNDGGDFDSAFGLTDNIAGACASTQSASINLFPLANNGCMTTLADGTCAKTHGFDANSAAISQTVSNLTDFDQRGFVVIDGQRDTGAYQFLLPEEQCGNNQLGLITGSGIDFFSANVANEFELNQAIICANMDDTTTDTILLNSNINLTQQITNNPNEVPTGTALIKSHIVLGGNGFTVRRDAIFNCSLDSAGDRTEFRLFKIDSAGQLDLKQITLENGCADSGSSLSYGGAVYNRGILSLENSQIKDSKSRFGGGLANRGTVLSIQDSIFSNNEAIQDGGGIYNSGSISEVLNSEINNNKASFGAGIFNGSTINSITDSTLYANHASWDAGGIYNANIINLIKNSTLSGNHADDRGGGIYVFGDLNILHVTFSNNHASEGAAVFVNNNAEQVNINKSLFHENTGTHADCGGDDTGVIVSGGDNLSSQSSADNICNFSMATGLNPASVDALADNGCFFTRPLANGSCVKTHALLPQSEAINLIAGSLEPRDQRNFNRSDGSRDVGAFEYLTAEQQCSQSSIDITSSFTKVVANASELTQAIVCANADINTVDTINLGGDISVSLAFENIDTGIFNDVASKGRTGTPAISSPVILNGMGFSLMREAQLSCDALPGSAPEDPEMFRLLRVADTGSLDLSNIIIANGCVSQDSQLHKFFGGGIYNEGTLSVVDSVFSKNTASTGAGLYNFNGTISQIRNSIFYQNANPGFFGGGLANDGGQIISITNNEFNQNSAFFGGGGLANMGNGSIVTIAQNTFSDNSSPFIGAALYNFSGASVSSIENSTFSNNTGSTAIGNEAIVNNISNSTFVGNDFGINNEGGTIDSINNSIIDACLNRNGAVQSGSNNLSDDINHNCPGTTRTPLLGLAESLQDNGCITLLADGRCVSTYALLAESEAIDGSDANATTTDQRGFAVTGIRDIGAFESVLSPSDVLFKDSFEH